ncbi:threonyl/alanyl tRNA synthetase [Pochonia chlamydosporia 170]|uniref:Threonyl/alanyl tRNA synthetase n=1 Tax=Pochonia chlamydosporia 170 TaxID=1380566 RepID=A0A179F220_METCM|nr:threonyl/alanyl tRNA synthetase [Pochonia chlamydosporia 170]OAQ59163.1 threonyl/alanyl tRNA synthetase [Pochonia chlamydosporia 170]
MTVPGKTHLAFQYNGKLTELTTKVHSVRPFTSLEEPNQLLFKNGGENDFVIVTSETIFHPQGGGQPSDEGFITWKPHDATTEAATGSSSGSIQSFQVRAVRMDAVNGSQVLHLGTFTTTEAVSQLHQGDEVKQILDQEKRLLYSRLHTAGHVLGSAVRSLLETEIPGFDELKASHFPDSAACEFQGAIEGKWKEPIQARVNEYLEKSMPVEIDFWTEEDFRREGLERLIPDRRLLPPGEDKFRVVRIVGAEVYPCGGTHVDTTDLCGETKVKKIARSKGVSRVSYTVA